MTHTLTIVGIGSHSVDDLPLGVYRFLKQQQSVYAGTLEHPVIKDLKSDIEFKSFDDVYEKYDQFEAVYQYIVETLIEETRIQDTVYVVPGHPRIAETTTAKLLDYNKNNDDIHVKILGRKSFIDDIFVAIDEDPNDGFTSLDGTILKESTLNIRTHTLITQACSAMIAADAKLTLMECYPDDFKVKIATDANNQGAKILEVPLFESDHNEDVFNNLTSVSMPKITRGEDMYTDFDSAVYIIDHLMDDEKDRPWDCVQTYESLKRYLLEEIFELFEAIDNEDDWHMIEEFGDILLQVLLHVSIGKKEGYMDIKEVIESLNAKMIHRHPHMFGGKTVETTEDLNDVWKSAKAKAGKIPRAKLEEVFANYFMTLYDRTENKDFNEETLKNYLQQGENDK